MKILKLYKYIIPVFLLSIISVSCKKLVDSQPKDVLNEENMYRNVADADAAVLGLYGKFMNLAQSYVILNELRADLMSVTTNSDDNFRQLEEHNVKEDNPYANPRPFYTVILNCNDILYNLDIMLRDKRLKTDEYNMRYSDVAALRCWVYLQLGIHFGKVPYITNPLSNVTDVNNIAKMTPLDFNPLLDSLIKKMEALPYLQPYTSAASLVTTVDGYTTNKFFINKQALLGELYLWKGNYHQSAIAFKNVMETGGIGDVHTYRLEFSSIVDNNDLNVGYIRYRELDENMLVNNNSQGWRSIFARSQDGLFNREWVWFLPYNANFSPSNPFIDLFSNRSGKYLVKPSQYAINNWNGQVQRNDFTYDARGKIFSWRSLDGQPVIMKYLYNFLDESSLLPANVFTKNGKWFLYRAAALHLEYAEAANRDNHHTISYALVNQGLAATLPGKISTDAFPYNFDARKSDIPKIVGDWYTNVGVRGRANVYSQPIVGDSTLMIENQIINEAGLELAYEGKRWSDLLRIALRRNDPAFLADKIYNKLISENNPQASAVRAKLMTPANWYLPFKWK
jgi:hypothetical protein